MRNYEQKTNEPYPFHPAAVPSTKALFRQRDKTAHRQQMETTALPKASHAPRGRFPRKLIQPPTTGQDFHIWLVSAKPSKTGIQ